MNVFLSFKKNAKNGLSFYSFLRIGWCFILNKKNWKMNVLFIFSKKIYILECFKKNDFVGIKGRCWKIRHWNFFFEKRGCIKENRNSVTRQRNLQKKNGLGLDWCFRFFRSSSKFIVHALAINYDRSNLFVHNMSFHTFHVMHACIICTSRH